MDKLTPLTPEKIAEWTALEKAATPGPWQINGSHIYGPDPEREIVTQAYSLTGNICNDRDFIAAARTAVPALLAERDALLARVAAAENCRDEWIAFASCDCPVGECRSVPNAGKHCKCVRSGA